MSTTSSTSEDFVPPPTQPVLQEPYNYDINGINYNVYSQLDKTIKQYMSQCSFCSNFYQNNSQNNIITTEYSPGEIVCFHCIFFLNYNPPTQRVSVDGVYKKTIVEYIMECHQSHKPQSCTHSTECFICDYLNGIPIEGIFGAENLMKINIEPEINAGSDSDCFTLNIEI